MAHTKISHAINDLLPANFLQKNRTSRNLPVFIERLNGDGDDEEAIVLRWSRILLGVCFRSFFLAIYAGGQPHGLCSGAPHAEQLALDGAAAECCEFKSPNGV